MLSEKCPKCGGVAHYELVDNNLVLCCMCGLHKFMRFTDSNTKITVETRLNKKQAELPKKNSKMARVLGVLGSRYPETMSTQELANSTGENMNDVSSRIVVLYHRQLVDKVTEGKTFKGGSTWVLSLVGAGLLGVTRD